MIKKLNLGICVILLLFLSCRADIEPYIIEKETSKLPQKFYVFSQNNTYNKDKKGFDYAKVFAYVAERYDSINKTNVTGLVNTTNKVTYNRFNKIRHISKNVDFYVEFRLHSQTIFEENGDVWVLFPKIKDGKVIDLLATVLAEDQTMVYYPIVDKKSQLFIQNISTFQQQYKENFVTDESGNVYRISAASRCGFEGEPACDIQEVIISPPPKNSSYTGGSGVVWGPDSPGGDCGGHNLCLPPDSGGGGGDNTNPNTPSNNPCAKAQVPSSTATLNSKAAAYTNAQAAIVGMNNGLENGVVLGNVNGTIQATGVQTGGTSSIGNLTSSFSNPIGDIHNHPNNNPPSSGDVYSLIDIRNQFSEYNTRYVITQDGTTYALIVTDSNAMNNFLQNYPPSITLNPNGGNFVDFPPSLFEEWTDLALGFSESGAIAYILNKYNSGITLAKMDGAGNFRAVNITTSQNSDGTTNYNYSLCPN